LRYVDEIWFDLKAAISTNAKPEIVLLRFGRRIALSRWRPRRLNTTSGLVSLDVTAEISQMEAEIYFYDNPKWLGKGSIFFQNQECINIL